MRPEGMQMTYDSTPDVDAHISEVRRQIKLVIEQLVERGDKHDCSKHYDDEKQLLDESMPNLKGLHYGSTPYLKAKEGLKEFLSFHHARNSHHPEYYENGISGMDLFDVIEMLCDWIASNSRDKLITIESSMEVNIERFRIDPQLAQILHNTILRWPKGNHDQA